MTASLIKRTMGQNRKLTKRKPQLGRVNLLTPTRVKAAAAEIKTGEMVPLKSVASLFSFAIHHGLGLRFFTISLPLHEPDPPAFHRKAFEHTIKPLGPAAFDDECKLRENNGSKCLLKTKHQTL